MPKVLPVRENTNSSSAYETTNRCEVVHHKFILRSGSVENRGETIINSAYCRFLCLISLHTACVNSYTFSAAQIQVIIFDSGLLVQYIVISSITVYIHVFYSVND